MLCGLSIKGKNCSSWLFALNCISKVLKYNALLKVWWIYNAQHHEACSSLHSWTDAASLFFFTNVRYSRAACFSICVIAREPKTQTDTDTEVVSEWIKSGVSCVYIRCVQRLILPHNTIFYSIFYCAVIKPEAPACITQTLKKILYHTVMQSAYWVIALEV